LNDSLVEQGEGRAKEGWGRKRRKRRKVGQGGGVGIHFTGRSGSILGMEGREEESTDFEVM
jgi:hypothetical protein